MKISIFLIAITLSNLSLAKFGNESELAVINSGGNTEQETWNAKTLNSLLVNETTYKLGGHYTYGKADGDLNARNWDLMTRIEHKVGSKWSLYSGVQREEDTFALLEYRWNYDFGGIYQILKNEKKSLKAETGYRRTLESDLEGRKSNGTKLRIYTEYINQKNENLYLKFWVEALPNVSETDDWQINFEPSMNYTLSKMMTLKIAYLHKYDNLPPQDSKKNDYVYTTSLIAKF